MCLQFVRSAKGKYFSYRASEYLNSKLTHLFIKGKSAVDYLRGPPEPSGTDKVQDVTGEINKTSSQNDNVEGSGKLKCHFVIPIQRNFVFCYFKSYFRSIT